MPLLATIVRFLGFGGCIAVAMFVFYEGLPLGPIRYIPWVGPQLEQLVDGRVDREYRRGESAERAVWREKQRDADERYLRDVQRKQDAIDQLTLDYLNLKAQNRANVVALDEAIAEAEKEEADAPADPAAPRSCVGIPDRVWKSLDAVTAQ